MDYRVILLALLVVVLHCGGAPDYVCNSNVRSFVLRKPLLSAKQVLVRYLVFVQELLKQAVCLLVILFIRTFILLCGNFVRQIKGGIAVVIAVLLELGVHIIITFICIYK